MSEQKLSEKIRYFSFHLGVLHGTKAEARRFFRDWADEAEKLEAEWKESEAKLAEYENDETPTRRELALVKRKLERMEQAFRGRGYHEPGMKRCQHGMTHWVGTHCIYDEPILAAQQESDQ